MIKTNTRYPPVTLDEIDGYMKNRRTRGRTRKFLYWVLLRKHPLGEIATALNTSRANGVQTIDRFFAWRAQNFWEKP
jgi:hypothetical protein